MQNDQQKKRYLMLCVPSKPKQIKLALLKRKNLKLKKTMRDSWKNWHLLILMKNLELIIWLKNNRKENRFCRLMRSNLLKENKKETLLQSNKLKLELLRLPSNKLKKMLPLGKQLLKINRLVFHLSQTILNIKFWTNQVNLSHMSQPKLINKK